MAKIHNFFGNSSEAEDMRCASCGLSQKCKSPNIEHVGRGKKEILIVIDSVDNQMDRSGRITDGQSYKFLNTELRKLGIDLYQDCWVTPCIKCNLDTTPTKKHMMQCNFKLMDEIKELKPKFIWTFGNLALGSITDKYYLGIQDTHANGDIIPITEFNAYLTPLQAIFVIQGAKKDPNFQSVVQRNIKKAWKFANSNPKFKTYNYTSSKNVEFVLEFQDVIDLLDSFIEQGGEQAIDFETTGLKPHKQGHKITTMSISDDECSYAFPIDYKSYWPEEEWEQISDKVTEYLECEKVIHIAHNKIFENLWSNVLLGSNKQVDVCTMATQHVLDNRKGTKGLKYQVFRRWGLYGYDNLADKYIKSVNNSDGANGFNKMDEMPLPEQLLYVGLDSFLTMKLYRAQQKELKSRGKLRLADTFWQESVNSMSTLQNAGIHIDEEYFERTEKELTERIEGLRKSIHANEDVKKFAEKHRRPFNETSPDDLKHLLFKQMGITSIKETESGGDAVDAQVLKELNIPVANYILDIRKYLKLRDTYIGQYKREVVDGYMHPFFYLTTTNTMRSSSADPNLQNVPKRDKESKKIIRQGLIPRPGRRLAEIDFSGMEVSTSATYHKDPNFIKYLTTGADMHKDNACDIWMLKPEEITGMIRFFVKNGWTFPQFYGDWYGSCSKELWKSSVDLEIVPGFTLKDHLLEKGIKKVEEFTEHCKTAEDILWNKRFKGYSQWKKDINDFYLKNGYVETHFGFQFTGYMDRKQTANYPIQGTAFHLLLFCINTLLKRKKEYGWKSEIVGQVHDSGIPDLVPEEEIEVLSEFKHIAEVELAQNFKWINVPFRVDTELSEINGTFADLTEYKLKDGILIKAE